MISQVVLTSLLASQAYAHFSIEYPTWRGDSFQEGASQWTYPCANVNSSSAPDANRTAWPLTGGSLSLDLHHPWTYLFINLGMGVNTSTFNISMFDAPLNETGNGTLCFSKLLLPTDLGIQEGANASIQVVTVNEYGGSLYNCADIYFSSTAEILSGGQCTNTTGLTVEMLSESPAYANESSASMSSSGAAATSDTAASSTGIRTSDFGGILWMLSAIAVVSMVVHGFL